MDTIKTKTVKVGTLLFDDELLYLRPVDQFTVSRYRQAMRSGADFPRITIATDGTIVCGNHRATAYIAEYGPDYEITAIVEKYKTRREMVERFAVDNTIHGLPLTGFQRRSIAAKLTHLGATPEKIANLFGVSVSRIQEWAGQSVYVVGNPARGKNIVNHDPAAAPAKVPSYPKEATPERIASGALEAMPIKRSATQIAGAVVKADDYDNHKRGDIGLPDEKLATQLTRHIYAGWIDASDLATLTAIAGLYEAIKLAGLDKVPVEATA